MSPGGREAAAMVTDGDIQPEVEVLPETAGGDRRVEVDIGRGDDADVDRDRRAGADAHDLALLEDAEQLHLERRRQVADLVEEQRAAIGGLEPARLRPERAGEGALLVAEQLGLDEGLDEARRN